MVRTAERQNRSNYSMTLPKEPWSTQRGANKISSYLNKDVYDGIHAPAAEAIWTGSGWAQEEVSHLVDTKVLHQAAKELPVMKRLCVMKHQFGMFGVKQFMKRLKYRNTSKCPQCGHIM
jgi:hypothetical protein